MTEPIPTTLTPTEPDVDRMDPVVKELWLEALESGDHAQGRGKLCRVTNDRREYCCLGVLSRLAADRGRALEYVSEGLAYYSSSDDEYGESNYLTRSVSHWADLDHEGTIMVPNPTEYDPHDVIKLALAELNDDGFSFAQIADLIRRFL